MDLKEAADQRQKFYEAMQALIMIFYHMEPEEQQEAANYTNMAVSDMFRIVNQKTLDEMTSPATPFNLSKFTKSRLPTLHLRNN